MPQKLLVQVPRYGREFKMFQAVVPDKILQISSLCDSHCLSSASGELNAHLKLLSVLCIQTSHYVCFTLSNNTWIFMDSMADRVGESPPTYVMITSSIFLIKDDRFNIPLCDDCTELLEEWVYSGRHRRELAEGRRLPELVRRFTQDMYMCVYVEDSTAV